MICHFKYLCSVLQQKQFFISFTGEVNKIFSHFETVFFSDYSSFILVLYGKIFYVANHRVIYRCTVCMYILEIKVFNKATCFKWHKSTKLLKATINSGAENRHLTKAEFQEYLI